MLVTYKLKTGEGDNYGSPEQKRAHAKFLRDTKPMRDAAKALAASRANLLRTLEARCGHGWVERSDDFGACSMLDLVREYLRVDEFDDKENLPFLEKLAPKIEDAFASVAGFKTWAEFEVAYEAKRAADAAAGEADDESEAA